ncbi:hypothetical protein FA15DRAFT_672449 [Coprinopsis marcescibilis]|uniref:WD40 repeat-like protein n=1 Tax=Coprinopsis marcescibilis TaxID=230819 RepID=A0A5C3KMR5_COPMA|nr:hypothetical protein FA15DRAFT_672449 [Coprinopsis marcescibilis]
MVVLVWDISQPSQPRKLCEWGPRGAIFKGLAVNTDPDSPAILVVSFINQASEHHVHVLSLDQEDDTTRLSSLVSFPTNFVPMALAGTRVALSDDRSQTAIWDWSTNEYAILDEDMSAEGSPQRSPHSSLSPWQHNQPAQVVFTFDSILVVRARLLSLFFDPQLSPSGQISSPHTLPPIATFSFGWLDGVSVASRPSLSTASSPPSYHILLRAESDDPWSPSDAHTLDLYTLAFNPEYLLEKERRQNEESDPGHPSRSSTDMPLPYTFPPRFQTRLPTSRGALRCTGLRLGKCGTALWVRPSESIGRTTGLVQFTSFGSDYPMSIPVSGTRRRDKEWLMAAILPGSPLDANPKAGGAACPMLLLPNEDVHDWTCFDYDEASGRIVLGKGDGDAVLLCI